MSSLERVGKIAMASLIPTPQKPNEGSAACASAQPRVSRAPLAPMLELTYEIDWVVR